MFDLSRYKDLEYLIITAAMDDKKFRKELLADAKNAIEKKFEIKLPKGIAIEVIQDTKKKMTIVLPPVDIGKKVKKTTSGVRRVGDLEQTSWS